MEGSLSFGHLPPPFKVMVMMLTLLAMLLLILFCSLPNSTDHVS